MPGQFALRALRQEELSRMSFLLVLLVIVTISTSGCGQPAVGSNWPMGGKDAMHSSRRTYTPPGSLTSSTPPFSLKWSYFSGDATEYIQGTTAIGPEGRLYIGTQRPSVSGGRVICLSPAGGLIWKYEADSDGTAVGAVCGCPALGQTAGYPYGVFFGDELGRLRCLSPEGALIWRSENLNGTIAGGPVIAQNGRVYVGTFLGGLGDGKLYAFNPNGSGTSQVPLTSPQFQIVGGMNGSPTVVETGSGGNTIRHLFCLGQTGTVYHIQDGPAAPFESHVDITGTSAYPLLNGNPVAIVDDPSQADGYHIVFGTYLIGVSPHRGYIYALLPNLDYRWWRLPNGRVELAQTNSSNPTIDVFGIIEGYPCAGSSGEVYLGTQVVDVGAFQGQGHLLKITESDGGTSAKATIILATATRVDCVSMFSINSSCTSGKVIVTPEYEYAHAIRPDGTLASTYNHGKSIDHTALAMGDDGTVYFGTSDGHFYALWSPETQCGSE